MKKIKLLKRQRINHILSAIYDYPLTIVEAPMGYGKTTAVKSFLQNDRNSFFWITFLNSIESISFFWEKFVNEISKIDDNVSKKLKTLGFPNDTPRIEKVLSLLGDISFCSKTVFVIDDFHLSTDIDITRLLMQIAAEYLDNLHIVIITRDTTNIDFAEPMSKGVCYVVSQQQLKFNTQEVNDYCLMMMDNISKADLVKINEYTDGWISLVYIILLALENGIPVGMNSSIDELIEKVMFEAYDEHIRNFLLKLSIMNAFTAKQALYVTREDKTNEFLKRLQKENAFVFYDEAAKTYKIHNVLLDYLRIKQHFEKEELQGLYRRLGEWHIERNEFSTAYSYFNKAGDVERILAHLNEPQNISNELTQFEGSFEMFNNTPEELLYKYPIAYLQHILLYIVKGDKNAISDCAARLQRLKEVYEAMENIDEDYRNHIIAEILIFKRFTTFNVINSSDACNNEIIRLLNGEQSYIMRRENEFTFGSPHLLYVYFRDRGTFKQIAELAMDRFTAYTKFANGCGTGCEYLILAEYALETGDLEAVELNCFKAIYKAKTKDQSTIVLCANFTLIRLYILQGKVKEGIELLKKLEKEISELNSALLNTTIDMCKGYIYALLGQPEKIPYWLQAGNMESASFLYKGIAFNYIVYGKAILASKNYVAMEVLSESFQEHFAIFKNQLGFIHNDILNAIAKYYLYGTEKGIAALKNALSKGQPDDIIMPFVENAPHIIGMLKIIASSDSSDRYLKKILLYSERFNESLKDSDIEKVSLSQREVEVLSLAAEGLKRDEIAARLSVSMGTVKTHLQNIYQKLEVSGKTAAIKAAQMHGLI